VNVLFEIARAAGVALRHGYAGHIVERHHEQKKDKPSGTAAKMKQLMDQAGGVNLGSPPSARATSWARRHPARFGERHRGDHPRRQVASRLRRGAVRPPSGWRAERIFEIPGCLKIQIEMADLNGL
jgi:hypothetical protein